MGYLLSMHSLWHWMSFSPSRRTGSSIVTDCQSEAVGLIVIINRTGCESWMRQMRVLDEANANSWWGANIRWIWKSPSLPPFMPLKCRCIKGWRHGREIRLHSRFPPVFGDSHSPYLYIAEFEQNEVLKRILFCPNTCKPQFFFVPLPCILRCMASEGFGSA